MPAEAQPSFPFRLEFPPELPISARAEEITAAIAAGQVLILAGETGSGKTTQIPKLCLAAGRGARGRIACTQPRRVAALSVSRRVAEEMGVAWGREVGCKVRFDDRTSSATVVKFLTDGMLLAEVQGDPLLREYDTVIIDEAHERSLNIDFLLGHLRGLRHRRPDLKIVITSATIDTAAFSAAFDGAPVIQVEGRMFPVEVIHAPLDSLGRDYAENDENEDRHDAAAIESARAEALHYIDGAVESVERIARESSSGDILVFLPSERDIREAGDLLAGRRLRDCELVPLYGRLSNAEQQRVFAPTNRRKVVLATNIAETSLTIPGIRYVVDTGLARVSRYAPQARTRRLPIEPVAQSSADQRRGRAGRVAEGVCIRLYSEQDYLARPRFAQPEIQRANLADVILRLKAFGLGDIERFPFINMPSAKAVRAGYGLLEELGATAPGAAAGTIELTPVGRELARLPVDPTVARMILQAREEKALREVVVIAAGLSIQDPRERPLDRQAQADAAHRRFAHPDSDFLTLLAIWDAFHDEVERMTQARLRRFCRDHFLSYPRMREWRDIHAQLMDALEGRDGFRVSSAFSGMEETDPRSAGFGTPAYRAIHRSILAGLLGNIAQLDEESGAYKATQDRRVGLFPGSVLFRREDPRAKHRPREGAGKGGARPASRGPRWIMASEIVETTRLYARTCARIDPLWALEIGAHVVRVAHSEPFWNAEAGRVMVRRRSRLYGLELESRAVAYGKIDPRHATEIFIREGLVNDTITFPLDCLSHNRAVREKIEDLLTRARDSSYLNLDEAAYRFYAARLLPGRDGAPAEGVSAVGELVALVRERRGTESLFLKMEPADLRDPATVEHDAAAFPAALPLSTRVLPLNYAYRPGQADDGVTLEVGVGEAEALTPAALDWAVPGHLEAKVEHHLRVLPKELRRAFVPLADTARSLSEKVASRDRLTERRESLVEALAAVIAETHGIALDAAVWSGKPPPDHLRVRVRVMDGAGRELAASRDLAEIRTTLVARSLAASASVAREEPAAWRAARGRWETPPRTTWDFDGLPERVLVTEQAGAPVYAFPGLQAGPDGVSRRLFRTPDEAAKVTRRGLAALFEAQLGRDLMWTQRDLRALRELGPLTATLASVSDLETQAFASIRDWVTGRPVEPADAGTFSAVLERARADLRGVVPRLGDLLREILSLRLELQVAADVPPAVTRHLGSLLPADFLQATPFPRLAHFPRYLKAMRLRVERARRSPAKDAEREGQVAGLEEAWRKLPCEADPAEISRLRWQLEELRVSLFAQELGTAEPVSALKIERRIAELRFAAPGSLVAAAPAAPPAASKPIVAVAAKPAGVKPAPVKSLGALDRLLGHPRP